MDFQKFYAGESFEAYRFLGAHVEEDGVVFRTFAPDARSIALIGEFNGWQETPMEKIYDGNFWECRVPQARPGMKYKYRITGGQGKTLDHCDPYGFASELRPNTASVIDSLEDYTFRDQAWMAAPAPTGREPLNIYEVHAGSWKKKGPQVQDWYNYAQLAELLIPYLKENGYNYLELMPLAEYPSDDSWGYQGTGFFSPTSRYGTPRQLRQLVDRCHQNGIGVILDFVPVHFATDDYALWNYDGSPLYQYPHQAVGYSQWGSCNFMHSRGEVRSFLQSSAYYWLKEFHMDGLRMDAVNNLIYWQGTPQRGENKDAIAFVQTMNRGLKARLPRALLIAEDSSSYPGVTKPLDQGGLGFDYKWDLGWMNDTLHYLALDPAKRPGEYHKLTFSMWYYYNERYLLPLSHDEVVHGKGTILEKMYGPLPDKLAQARALYLYMMAHPGKKLNFMGNETGQLREWDQSRALDWDLAGTPDHQAFAGFIRDLNRLYLTCAPFYQQDYEREGFVWLDCSSQAQCIYAFERRAPGRRLAFLFNFSRTSQPYTLSLEGAGALTPLLYSQWRRYGGCSDGCTGQIPCPGGKAALTLDPFSALCLEVQEKPAD